MHTIPGHTTCRFPGNRLNVVATHATMRVVLIQVVLPFGQDFGNH
jgi:hypothetical protein